MPSRAASFQAHCPSSLGLPVLSQVSSCLHALAYTPAGTQASLIARTPACIGSLPQQRVGSAPALPISRPHRLFTCVRACLLADRPIGDLCVEGSDSFVTSAAASTATGWNDQLPGGYHNPLKTSSFSRRTRCIGGLCGRPAHRRRLFPVRMTAGMTNDCVSRICDREELPVP